MKLRNKRTGEIIIPSDYTFATYDDGIRYGRTTYYSLAELNEEWEDYEEQKKYYFITSCGEITHRGYRLWGNESVYDKKRKEIGNYFETNEEALEAVEKLKAWKRLKDNGIKFEGWKRHKDYCGDYVVMISMTDQYTCDDEDLDLLFGGEE